MPGKLLKAQPIAYPEAGDATTTASASADTVVLPATNMSGIKNYTLYVQNDPNATVSIAFDAGKLQASFSSAGPWADIDTSLNTLASQTLGRIKVIDNSDQWIRFVCQGNGGTVPVRTYLITYPY